MSKAKKPRKSAKMIEKELRASIAAHVKEATQKGLTTDQIVESVLTGKDPGGAPRIEIDMDKLREFAGRALSIEQTAAALSAEGTLVHHRTIKRRLAEENGETREEWTRGQMLGKGKLRARMFQLAMQNVNLNVAQRAGEFLLITWDDLQKPLNVKHSGKVELEEIASPYAELTSKLEQIRRRQQIASRVDGLAVAAGASTVAKDADAGAAKGVADGLAVLGKAQPTSSGG